VPLAIASGALRREIEAILGRAHLRGCFRAIVGADDAARSKPAPDPYVEAVKRLRPWLPAAGAAAVPRGIVAIEDSVWGLESARAAGLRTVGVATTYPPEALSEADLVVGDLSEISVDVLVRIG
jgi:beta-phosphoglucomutase-like phosphatase (HAD superfamily)